MKDKAPRLIDYIVGFQLVDRNEDNTKAIGVFGFKVGKQWLYAPVFFLNGDLKGHELLYIKNQDAFVPMKENWVNYIMSRKPHILGEGSRKDTYQLGGLTANINRLAFPPSQGKYANDLLALAADFDKQAGGFPVMPPVPGGPVMPPVPGGPAPTAAPEAQMRGMTTHPAGGGTGMTAQVPQQQPAPVSPAAAIMPPANPEAAGLSPAQLPQVEAAPPAQGMGGMAAGANPLFEQMKGAGMIDEWARPFVAMYAAAATKKASFLAEGAPALTLDMKKVAAAFDASLAFAIGDACDLERFIAADWRVAKFAFDLAERFPGVKLGFDRFYGKDFFQRVGRRCKAAHDAAAKNILPVAPRIPWTKAADWVAPGVSIMPHTPSAKVKRAADAVKIITKDDVPGSITITDKEKEHVLSHGYLVKDERTGEQTSSVYNTQVKVELTNPHETGLYEVLEAPGDFDRMLVISHPSSNTGGKDFCTVVRIGDGDKAWINAHRTAIFARKVELREEFDKWWDGLGDKDTLSKGGTYVLLNKQGEGTTAFTVDQTFGDGRYRVSFHGYMDNCRGRTAGIAASAKQCFPGSTSDGDYVSEYGAILIFNDRKGSKLRAIAGEMHVPTDGFKVLTVKAPQKPKKDEDDGPCSLMPVSCCDSGSGSEEPKPIVPGDIKDVQLLFTEKTARLKLLGDSHEVTISSEKVAGHVRLGYGQALFHLIRVHGLSEKAAKACLSETQRAALTRRGAAVFRVKYADQYPGYGDGPNAPAIPEPQYGTEQVGYGSVNAIYPQEEAVQVPELDSQRTDPKTYDPFLTPDAGAMQTAQQAASEGQKEVFDTSMISGMLKAVRQDSLVDRNLGDLMKAVDKLGRLLFMFYWHGEEFEDRYGKGSMPEMEDSLRNAFEQTGDIVLFLKEKTIEPGLDETMDPNIEQSARN